MNPRILFVDDEVNVLDGLMRMLHGSQGEWDLEFVSSVAQGRRYFAGRKG